MKTTANSLNTIVEFVKKDPGLRANISQADINGGAAGAVLMNEVINIAIDATGVNEDGRISPDDARKISDFIRADADLLAQFVEGHGDDEGNEETGYHLVQGDGGTLKFQGRKFVDTVADAIYHIGFTYKNGRFRNEDGNANETVDDIAGWLNYFVNGENVVYGTGKREVLYSGEYSDILSDAQNETFMAGAGNDDVWAGEGDDEIWAGSGHDNAGGGEGDDLIYGEGGNDKLWGNEGNDTIHGGTGNDTIGGHEGDDALYGGNGKDLIYGHEGDDMLFGDDGNDIIVGGDGQDMITGGKGRDILRDWESVDAKDTFLFAIGDTGTTKRTMDVIEGFDVGQDKIDLTGYSDLTFVDAFSGGGSGEVLFDGNYVRIDADGDGSFDAGIEVKWINEMSENDFIL